jgi:hypothetical protein
MTYIFLSKMELEHIIKKAYVNGQNNNIQLTNNMDVPHNLDEYVQNEIEQIFKQQQTDEWLK